VVSKDVLDIYPRKVCFFPHSGKAMVKRLAPSNPDAIVAQERAVLQKAPVATPSSGSVELF
jgi:chemotaxis protein CheD